MRERETRELLADADAQLADPASNHVVDADKLRTFARRRPVQLAAVGLLVAIAGLYVIASSAGERAGRNSAEVRELKQTQQQLRRELAEERRQRDELAAQVAGANALLGARVEQLLELLAAAGVTVPALTAEDVRRLMAGQEVTTPAAPSRGNRGPRGPQGPPGPAATSSPAPGASSRPSASPQATSRPTPSRTPPPAVEVCVRNPITGARTCVTPPP